MGADLDAVWQVLDGQVAAGRFPGYVAAVRVGGQLAVRAGGRTAVEPGSPPMAEDTLFRIASLTKPIGAALAMSLVHDGTVGLDDEVARWLPELAAPRVLTDPAGPLDATVPARRPITVRHLLAMTCGWGAVLARTPLAAAMRERQVNPGPGPLPMTAEEYLTRLAGLPLAFHPGEGWLYDTGMNVLGVLLARAAGRPLSALVADRITGPLGMVDTAFWAADPTRLAAAYRPAPDGLRLFDPPDGAFATPPRFEGLSGGLVSTAADVLRFFAAMADGGAPVLTAQSLALMTTDALTPDQRAQAAPIVGPGASWALGLAVDLEPARPWMTPGRWGWNGGTGTTAHVHPASGTVDVLLTQRAMAGALDGFDAFWSAVPA